MSGCERHGCAAPAAGNQDDGALACERHLILAEAAEQAAQRFGGHADRPWLAAARS